MAICLSAAGVARSRASDRDLRLIDAAKAGDSSRVRALAAAHHGLVRVSEQDGTTALHWAALADDLEMVRILLRAGARTDAANRYGVTPLICAAMNGSAAVVEMLLDAGADPNDALPEGETTLMTAARTGSVGAIRALLDDGADVTAREHGYGETALMWAAAQDHAEAVRILLDYGADADDRSNATNSREPGGPAGGWTALMYAARQHAVAAAQALFDRGASLDVRDPDGTTPLLIAILSAHWDVASELLAAGADPNIADRTGMTPLYAVLDLSALPVPFGRPDRAQTGPPDASGLMTMLLDYGADPNAPLSAPIVQRLHTPPDAALGAGATPFMRAAKAADVQAMRLLLDYGANPQLVEADHTTALMIAAGMGWRDGFPTKPPYVAIRDRGTDQDAIAAIELCLDLGIDINAVNDVGDSALHAAADARGSVTIIQFLVGHGADLGAKNKTGQTPLDAALAHRDRAGTLLRESAVSALRVLMNGATSKVPPAGRQ